MKENNLKQLPKFESLDALADFFDDNDLGEYADQMPEAHFEVNLKSRKYFVAIDEELSEKLSEISRHEHLSSEAIVNSWLREKISSYSEKI